jgi:septal ring factor EnvC (AmiA/AmiB activator)
MIQIEIMRLSLSLILIFLAFALPAHARPSKAELQKVQSDLQSQKEKQAELARQQQDIEQKVDALQSDLVKLSRDMQEHEQKVLALHEAKGKTESDIADADKKLQSRRKSLATTIMALERLNQMPPQALLARPSAPIDMARSFDLLQKVIPAVSEQATEVKQVVKNLQDLHDTQDRQEQQLKDEQEQLAAQQKQLEAKVKERETLLAQNKSQQKDLSQKVATLSSHAANLQDLLHKIDEQAKRHPPKAEHAEEKPDIVGSVRDLFDHVVSSLGSARLPVTGHIATGFGQNTSEGVTSQGVTIAARPGSIVVAPLGGVIRFAGPFRQYKLLVIIQHPNGDHSLIGGMQELYTAVGAKVVAGEPLGKLPENNSENNGADGKLTGDSGPAASLYYERRHDGKPIDPSLARG